MIASAVMVVACRYGDAPPAPPEAPSPPLRERIDPEVLRLIGRFGEDGQTVTVGGVVTTWSESFKNLVRMGTKALPTLLYELECTPDYNDRSLMVEAAIRIGDASARPVFERMLLSADVDTRAVAAEGIGGLGMRESMPALRRQLERLPREAGEERLQVLEAMYRLGDTGGIGEVLRIGLTLPDVGMDAMQVLQRHPPLRSALGLTTPYEEGSFEFLDADPFLRAADMWYHEKVLGQPSPWRPPILREMTPPCAPAKQQALASLLAAANRDYRCETTLRV